MKRNAFTLGGVLLTTLAGVSAVLAQGPSNGISNPEVTGNPALSVATTEAFEQVSLGKRLFKQGDVDGATKAFRAATELRPNAEAYAGLGDVLEARGQTAEAVLAYRRAIYRMPGQKWFDSRSQDADLLMKFALLLSKAGQYEEAIRVYEQGLSRVYEDERPLFHIRFLPKSFNRNLFDAAAHVILGRMNHGSDNYFDNAIAEYQKALALKPDFAPAHFYLGEAKLAKGQKSEARVAWRKVLETGRGEIAARAQARLDR